VPGGLLFFFVGRHGFEVFGLEDLTTIETLDVVNPISSSQDLSAAMVANSLHD
jgi:hypothetical protein